ncbi:hypothetical protein XENTR_v10011910 [Xenopus tropicalis]|uniref:FYN-binding protein 2 isoform X2 n=1 Tax=Xenopus tropicalis TaxID=8364 RepID=A0A8J1JFX4_XENTR|nr:FYN-binding protein 2 isoform X2 [Xenopus tropicalis]KAE8609776.1 hypothetical protein XENTR_v10011910 [Xenopus tropicalis]
MAQPSVKSLCAKFLDDHPSQEALPLQFKESSSMRTIFRTSSNPQYYSVISELESKGRNAPFVLKKPAIPRKINPPGKNLSKTDTVTHCANIRNSPEASNKVSALNNKSTVDAGSIKKGFKETVAEEDVKYENIKRSFRCLPDTSRPPVPPKMSDTSSAGNLSYPPRAKGNSPGTPKDFPVPKGKPDILKKPKIIQRGVAVFPQSPSQATIPESTNITEETYETADLNIIKESKPITVKNNDISANSSSFLISLNRSDNSLSAKSKKSTADESSEAKQGDLSEKQVTKSGKQHKIPNAPKLKCLPSINSLNPPPKKPPRPPNVDLSAFSYLPGNKRVQITGMQGAETTDAVSSTKETMENYYDDSMSHAEVLALGNTIKQGSQGAEKNDADLSTEETPENYYDDSMSLVKVLPLGNTMKQELPGTRRSDYIASTEENECYQDILPLSPYSDNVFEAEPVSPEAEKNSLLQKEDSYEDAFGLLSPLSYSTEPDSGFCSPNEVRYSCSEIIKATNITNYPEPKPKDWKIDKKQLDFRKKYKISGSENTLCTTTVKEDFKDGKDMLSVKTGDTIEIIRITGCPVGKWLANNDQGDYGFIPVSSVSVSQEHLIYLNQPLSQESQYLKVYVDAEDFSRENGTSLDASFTSDGYADMSLKTCDVSSIKSNSSSGKRNILQQFFTKAKERPKEKNSTGKSTSSATDSYDEFSNDDYYSTTITEDDKKNAKQQKKTKPSKLEREFRDKFKYTKDIVVINTAIVNVQAPRLAKSKFDLAIKPGEELDVVDITDGKEVICRNATGKYGRVAIEHLNFISNLFSQNSTKGPARTEEMTRH